MEKGFLQNFMTLMKKMVERASQEESLKSIDFGIYLNYQILIFFV